MLFVEFVVELSFSWK